MFAPGSMKGARGASYAPRNRRDATALWRCVGEGVVYRMQIAGRRRTLWTIVGSLTVHAVVLAVVAIQHPTLSIPVEPSGPPEPIIPILLMPRTPPQPSGEGSRPAPIQRHRRAIPVRDEPPPIAPLIAPTAKPAPAAPAPTPAAGRESSPPPQAPLSDPVRATLRATLGCTESRLAGLSRDERQSCFDRLGHGAHEERYLPPQLSAEKRALLDQAGSAKMAQKTAAERAAPAARVNPPPPDYDGEPVTGPNPYGPLEHPPSKRAAQVLPRLPP